MFVKIVFLLLVCGLVCGFAKKHVKSSRPLLRANQQGEEEKDVPNDQINALHSQMNNHERLVVEAYDLIHQQTEKLSRQEDLLHQQSRIIEKQRKALENLLQEDTAHPKTKLSSSSHVETRSDDAGPLQEVVDQMALRISSMTAQIQTLQASYHLIENTQASTYVHWGSSQCGSSDNAELVYSGVVGGSYYSHAGAPANPLCLTMHPVASNHTVPSALAYLYGSEYYTYDEHQNTDPVCAVCRSKYSTTIMVPGTNVCSPGWRLNYEGFLMAGAYSQAGAIEYICVDAKFESRVGGDATHYGLLLYFTVTQCGSLPCQPYEKNKVVTCAVCSK